MAASRMPMSDLVSIRKPFLRSVHLERDFYARDSFQGYVVTSGATAVLSSLSRGHTDPAYRAQCISGPYGSGKSALALFFARLLDGATPGSPAERQDELLGVRERLFHSPELKYLTVLVTATREGLVRSLTLGLERSLQQSGMSSLRGELLRSRQSENARHGRLDSTRDIVQTYEDLARLAVQREKASGVLVVVDELGKLLEYAAAHPDEGDLHLLQEMAEAASRSREYPLWFITVLHQQFSQYAVRLGRRHQQEWMKVQQRFFDVPCLLDDTDALQLVAAATNGSSRAQVASNSRIQEVARACSKLGPRKDRPGFEELCISSYPLHPTVLLCLPSLFRRFGQNERSLFSFLAAKEPFSLSDWIHQKDFRPRDPPFFRLPNLYDYARHTLIGGAPTPQVARSWAEVDEALSRLGDASPEEIDSLKIIGLLSLLGEMSHLPASCEVLELALASSTQRRAVAVRAAIQKLAERRLVVFRRFRNAYRLWEGSDIDIGERLAAARQVLLLQRITVTVARDLCPSPPLVARRHTFERGMLRYFSVMPCSSDDFEDTIAGVIDHAGRIVQCLVEDDEQRALIATAALDCRDPSAIVLLGRETDELVEAARDVSALEWVKQNTPGLAGDRVARRELSERRLEAETAFRSEWCRVFHPGSSEAGVFWMGNEVRINTAKELTRLVSDACDATFPFAPVLKNELINRRRLSSATAAARQNLVEAMLSSGAEPALAITGYPPARSIYESLLLAGGIHRPADRGGWEFGRPSDADPGLQKAWDHILDAANSDLLDRKPVSELFNELVAPPYGLADGFVPVLFCAFLLAHSSTVALYESNIFVHELSGPVMERLMKNPSKFSFLRYDVGGERALVLDRFSRGFNVNSGVLPIVRSLYARIGSLNEYARVTRNLPADAIAVRDAIERARSPERLLFRDLPIAVGCTPFGGELEKDNADRFFNSLNTAFEALISCYPRLLDRIRDKTMEMMETCSHGVGWRQSITNRANTLHDALLDSWIRTVVAHARDTSLPDKEYIESIAAAITGRHPNTWDDADEDEFTRLTRKVAAGIRAAESLQRLDTALAEGENGYLVTVQGREGETRRIVRYPTDEEPAVQTIVRSLLAAKRRDVDHRVLLAALVQATSQLIRLNWDHEATTEVREGC